MTTAHERCDGDKQNLNLHNQYLNMYLLLGSFTRESLQSTGTVDFKRTEVRQIGDVDVDVVRYPWVRSPHCQLRQVQGDDPSSVQSDLEAFILPVEAHLLQVERVDLLNVTESQGSRLLQLLSTVFTSIT